MAYSCTRPVDNPYCSSCKLTRCWAGAKRDAYDNQVRASVRSRNYDCQDDPDTACPAQIVSSTDDTAAGVPYQSTANGRRTAYDSDSIVIFEMYGCKAVTEGTGVRSSSCPTELCDTESLINFHDDGTLTTASTERPACVGEETKLESADASVDCNPVLTVSLGWTLDTAAYEASFFLATPEQYYKLVMSMRRWAIDEAGDRIVRDLSCSGGTDADGADCALNGDESDCAAPTGECLFLRASPWQDIIGNGERCMFGGTIPGAQPFMYGYDPDPDNDLHSRDIFGGAAGRFKLYIQAVERDKLISTANPAGIVVPRICDPSAACWEEENFVVSLSSDELGITIDALAGHCIVSGAVTVDGAACDGECAGQACSAFCTDADNCLFSDDAAVVTACSGCATDDDGLCFPGAAGYPIESCLQPTCIDDTAGAAALGNEFSDDSVANDVNRCNVINAETVTSVFKVEFDAELASSYLIYATATTGAVVIGSGAHVISVVASDFSASTSEVSGGGVGSAIAGDVVTFLITGRDQYGNARTTGGQEFAISSSDAAISDDGVTDSGDGTFTGVYTLGKFADLDGDTYVPFTLSIQQSSTDEHVGASSARSPFSVYPTPGVAAAGQAIVLDPGFANSVAGVRASVSVRMADQYGNLKITGGDVLGLTVADSAGNPVDMPARLTNEDGSVTNPDGYILSDNVDGNYVLRYVFTTAVDYTLTIFLVDGDGTNNNIAISDDFPGTVTIVPAVPAGAMCIATGIDSYAEIVAAEVTTFTVVVRDQYSNDVIDDVDVSITHQMSWVNEDGEDQSCSSCITFTRVLEVGVTTLTYNAEWSSEVAAVMSIAVTLGSAPIDASPFSKTVIAVSHDF